MVTKATKEKTVEELKDKFSRAKSVFSTKQLGLSVEEITNLRGEIRELGAEFKIAKNTLFRKAAEGTDYASLTENLKGTTAFLFCYDDVIAPAGKVSKFAKENKNKVTIEGAFLDGELLDTETASKIASLPSKEILLSQIAGMLVQNTQSIAYIFSQLGEKEDKEKLLKEFIVAATAVESASGDGKEEKAAEAAAKPAETEAKTEEN